MKQINLFEFKKLNIETYDNIEELIKFIREKNITCFQVAEENCIDNLDCYIFSAIKDRYPEYKVSIFNDEHNFAMYCSREMFIDKDAFLYYYDKKVKGSI